MKQLLVFILMAGLLCWLIFSPLYKHVLIVRQAALQKEVDVLLEIGANASYGYIDSGMIAQSKSRLAALGFQTDDLIYVITTTNGTSGTDPNMPLLRGHGLHLTLSYPYDNLLHIDRLIGIAPPPDSARIAASGLKMSEYVPSGTGFDGIYGE